MGGLDTAANTNRLCRPSGQYKAKWELSFIAQFTQ